MLTCPDCGAVGKRRPRTFFERIVNRAKLKCGNCNTVWYWHRVLFQRYTRCPDCGTSRLSKLSKYDQIDRKTKSFLRRSMVIFGAPIYHCTFCRLQFRDYRHLDPNRPPKVRVTETPRAAAE
jgi:hypothetical protein